MKRGIIAGLIAVACWVAKPATAISRQAQCYLALAEVVEVLVEFDVVTTSSLERRAAETYRCLYEN